MKFFILLLLVMSSLFADSSTFQQKRDQLRQERIDEMRRKQNTNPNSFMDNEQKRKTFGDQARKRRIEMRKSDKEDHELEEFEKVNGASDKD